MQTHHASQPFIEAVKRMESSRSPADLIALFAADATLDTIALEQPLKGRPAIAAFWEEYLQLFKTIETRFTQTLNAGDESVLEWISTGTLATGEPVSYRGVSLLKFAGGRVTSFRVYYDSAQFIPEFNKYLNRKITCT
jgi:ketosteroid isomerase-like protein